jgi:hypothetical protein
MKPQPPPWDRLVAAARRAPVPAAASAPFGFATRVAAQGLSAEPLVDAPFERMALRAMGVACLLALSAVAVNYSSLRQWLNPEATPVPDDPVAELVTLGS